MSRPRDGFMILSALSPPRSWQRCCAVPTARAFHVEDIQDQVELALMRGGHHKVARAYVLYREERAKERTKLRETAAAPSINVSFLGRESQTGLIPGLSQKVEGTWGSGQKSAECLT